MKAIEERGYLDNSSNVYLQFVEFTVAVITHLLNRPSSDEQNIHVELFVPDFNEARDMHLI